MNEPEVYIGVDPGLDGAVVALDGETGYVHSAKNVPTHLTKEGSAARGYDLPALANLVGQFCWDYIPTLVIIEQVPINVRDERGALATAKLSRSEAYWHALFVAQGVPVELVAPISWKTKMGLPRGSHKEASLEKALQLMPHSSEYFQHGRGYGGKEAAIGRAEAALLAEWGRTRAGRR